MNITKSSILQPLNNNLTALHYLPSNIETISWGTLPNAKSNPVLSIRSGQSVTIDTVSHEGMLEDQGRNPVEFFAQYGISSEEILYDAVDICKNGPMHHLEFGPHIVTGPIEVQGAQVGDLLRIQVIQLERRVPYGIISSRHGYGALPGEMPRLKYGESIGSEFSKTVNVFCEVEELQQNANGLIRFGKGKMVRFPLNPFLGIMGVAKDTNEVVNSIPPGSHGGNLDINMLGQRSFTYLPVQVPGALFYVGDPHFAQGDGEVALTALEAPLRATIEISIIKSDQANNFIGILREPFGETDKFWIAIGLDEDLNEAMRKAVRAALDFLSSYIGMEEHLAYAYLSAAADFEVSQVVDSVKGVHCLIRKKDFRA